MRAQSEAIGLAVILALVIGGIVAYASFHKAPQSTGPSTDELLADNFAYVLIESDVNVSGCRERLTSLIDDSFSGADSYRCHGTVVVAPGVNRSDRVDTFPELVDHAINNVTRSTIDRWGKTYMLKIYEQSDPTKTIYDRECPSYDHSGVAKYSFGQPTGVVEFAICT